MPAQPSHTTVRTEPYTAVRRVKLRPGGESRQAERIKRRPWAGLGRSKGLGRAAAARGCCRRFSLPSRDPPRVAAAPPAVFERTSNAFTAPTAAGTECAVVRPESRLYSKLGRQTDPSERTLGRIGCTSDSCGFRSEVPPRRALFDRHAAADA